MGASEEQQTAEREGEQPEGAKDDSQGAESGEHKNDREAEQKSAREEMNKLEEADEVPSDPRDWPGGKAKYMTFGGGEGQSDDAYGEGVSAKLGPADVQHHEDGSVSVEGEKVDDPDKYKGEPIPGGPTDPNTPALAGEEDRSQAGKDAKDPDRSGRGRDKDAKDADRDQESERAD